SLRGSDERGLVWQSPSGLCKGDLDPTSFVAVDLASGDAVEPSGASPSGEMPVHLGIYRAVPFAGAVVHTHPPAVVAASRAGIDLHFTGEEMQKALGLPDHAGDCRIPVMKNPLPAEMPSMTELVPRALVAGI